jgi:2-C-methyl-D-erythritol 4-phosphate cytidylyltransferase
MLCSLSDVRYYAIIVAGGTGSRMNADLPKQFMLLKGKPVLMHTITAFYHSDVKPEIILVLNSAYHHYWDNLCEQHEFRIPCIVVDNGEQRFHSVKNALSHISAPGIIAVHDAVRPMIANDLITKTFRLAEELRAVVPVVTSRDSVRKREGSATVALNREDVLLVQTPQVFQSEILQEAYRQPYQTAFTDDASVVEHHGVTVHTTEGFYTNIKITYPEDLLIAEVYLTIKA